MAASGAHPAVCLEVRVHTSRGRGLYTTRHVRGGETVLIEEPVLLTVASSMWNVACAGCLRAVKGVPLAVCGGCNAAALCSQCQPSAHTQPWVHGPAVCSAYQALAKAGDALEEQDVDAGRFLAHAAALSAAAGAHHPAAAKAWSALCTLQGSATDVERRVVSQMMPLLSAALAPAGVSLPAPSILADLLRKEQLNSYGILAPAWLEANTHTTQPTQPAQQQQQQHGVGVGDADEEGEEEGWGRMLRGSAIYHWASLVNHECNPNVARFDAFDTSSPSSTHVVFRALHDLPPGTEIFQSYFPVTWEYEERQEHLKEVYGFTCSCQRCKLEATWTLEAAAEAGGATVAAGDDMDVSGSGSEWETDDEDHEALTAHMQQQQQQGVMDVDLSATAVEGRVLAAAEVTGVAARYIRQPAPGVASWPVQAAEPDPGPLYPTYLQLFLLKYVCSEPGCMGTLAPQQAGSSLLECSVCGRVRSEAQFLQELDA